MKLRQFIAMASAFMVVLPTSVFSTECKVINYQEGNVIDVNSAYNLGSRIQLPAKLIRRPVVTNAQMWNVGGDVGSNQIVLSARSTKKSGKSAMVFAFTDDGKVYDILVNRVKEKSHQSCVLVDKKPRFFFPPLEAKPTEKLKVSRLETSPITKVKTIAKQPPIIEEEFDPIIFTRYQWNTNARFVGNNSLIDIYDDGRQTFVRMDKPNQGIMTITSIVNSRRVEVPVKTIEDSFYSFNGVYPSFTVRVGNTRIPVTR